MHRQASRSRLRIWYKAVKRWFVTIWLSMTIMTPRVSDTAGRTATAFPEWRWNPDRAKRGRDEQSDVGSGKRTFQSALIHELETNYGFLNSKRMLALLAEDIQQLVEHFYPRRDYLPNGWVVLPAPATGPKASQGKTPGADYGHHSWPCSLPEDITWMATPIVGTLQRRASGLEHGWQHPQAGGGRPLVAPGLTTVEISTCLRMHAATG